LKLLLWVVKNRLKAFKKEGIRIRIVGSKEGVPSDALAALEAAEAETVNGTTMTLGVCFNYGGQQEIIDAYKNLLAANISPEALTTELFSQHIYEPEVPPIDLVIRTSGEQRLSGFMLWRAAYSELYFTDTFWPDFDKAELTKALDAYAERQRRYGA
jgi:undecaprenyl diphosphate synthase